MITKSIFILAFACGLAFLLMPPRRGGVRTRVKKSRPRPLEELAGEPDASQKIPTFKYGGRTRAKTMGRFFASFLAIGRLTGPEVQEGAAAHFGSSSGSSDALCKNLSEPGCGGKHRGNVHRDALHHLERRVSHKAQIYKSKISLWMKLTE